MPAIPPGLKYRLHQTLMRCSDMESDRATRALFVVDARLAPWRDCIPRNAPDLSTHVDLIIADLCDKISTHGKNALTLLLYVLADNISSGDALSGELLDLAHELEALPSTTSVAFSIPMTGRCDFYRHIDLPSHYIQRPDVLNALRVTLLSGAGAVALTSAVKVALHGMGGIGKTVLARAMCEDEAVRATFADGILWATLGQTPDLTARLREWIIALGGIISENAPTLPQLKMRLGNLLQDRACLLILDDVWKRTDVEPFQVGGPRCCLLFTTRDAEIAHDLNATLQPVDVLPQEQAEALLTEWAQGNLNATPPELTRQIAKRLGCLPLALKLAGAQLRDKDPAHWLETFNTHKLKSRREETLHDNLERTFALSLDSLDTTARQCYTALAIFKEDEPIPFPALLNLWGALARLSGDEASDLLNDLTARALLQRNPTQAALLHDLLRDFIRAELGEQGAKKTHHALLDAYRQTVLVASNDNGPPTSELSNSQLATCDWTKVSDDGYFYAHLAYHLDAIGDYSALQALFANDAWLRARVSHDNYAYDGYLMDLVLAWEHAQDLAIHQIADWQPPLAVAECIHYALIHTTINSLATSYDPQLVTLAMKVGFWPPEYIINLAQRISDPEKKIRMLHVLLATDKLTTSQRAHLQNQALTITKSVPNEVTRFRVLAELAPALSKESLEEAVSIATDIQYDGNRAEALINLIPTLKSDVSLLRKVLKTARLIYAGYRTKILAALALQLPDCLISEAVDIAQMNRDFEHRAEALVALAPRLSEDMLSQALVAVERIVVDDRRIAALVKLMPYLPERLLTEVSKMMNTKKKYHRALALSSLAVRQPEEQCENTIDDILAIARNIKDRGRRTEILKTLISQLIINISRSERMFAIERINRVFIYTLRAMELFGEEGQAEILRILAPYLSEGSLKNALKIISVMKTGYQQAKALVVLAQYLPNNLFGDAWEIAQKINDSNLRAEVFTELAISLKSDHPERRRRLSEVLEMARSLKIANLQIRLLLELEGIMEVEPFSRTVRLGKSIDDDKYQSIALAVLAQQAPDREKTEVLMAARNVIENLDHDKEKNLLLATLLPMFPKEQQKGVYAQLVDRMNNPPQLFGPDIKTQVKLFPWLSKNQQYTLISEVLRMNEMQIIEYVEILTDLAAHLDIVLRERVLIMALETIRAEEFQSDIVAQALIELAPLLSESLSERALEEVKYFNEELATQVLVAVAPQLSNQSKRNILSRIQVEVQTIKDKQRQAEILMMLAPQLHGEAQQKALADSLVAAQAVSDEVNRAKIVTALQVRMVQLAQNSEALCNPRQVLAQALRAGERTRAELLRLLIGDNIAFLRAFDLPPESYAQIAHSIIDICTKWDWL
ncbi:MAG: hypothetical protein JXA21_22190 [Anaerolineae bacterium]|nr:hypothetical protein [Anaerolineae bacterium]